MDALLMMLPDPIPIDPAWLGAITGPVPKTVRFSRWEKKALKKPKPIPVSEWAERHRVLPADSAIPGRWKNDTAPYLAGIMDASFFQSVQEIIVCAPPQTGKTDLANNCLGYAADRRPGNVLYVQPDELTARDNARDRLQPMFRESPRLKKYLTGYADDEGSLCIRLRNMKIYLAWANSAARLGNRPLPYVVLDEEDKYPVTANKREAGPADLAKKRTRTFAHMRKVWRLSTPTVEGGPIWRALETEAQAVFHYWVRCPACNAYQEMDFTSIRWPDRQRDARAVAAGKLAWYECPKCRDRWDDARRNAAARGGQWRDREKGILLETYLVSYRPVAIGFNYPSWVTPFVSMSEAAAAFLAGQRDTNKLKDFQNGHAAKPWVTYAETREESLILSLADDRPAGAVPGGVAVAALVAGVDTQDDGFWFEIRAFGAGEALDSWQVRFGFVVDLDSLARVLWEDVYQDADGNRYPVQLTCQDSAGHRTAEVYEFCRRHRGRIHPTVGRQTQASPFIYSNQEYFPGTKKPIPGGLVLVRVHVNYYKNDLSSRLAIKRDDPGSWRMCSEVTEEWAAHMTAEARDAAGIWVQRGNRANHGWDCAVLCRVAADILGVRYWKRPPKDPAPIPAGVPAGGGAGGDRWLPKAAGGWLQR